MDNIAVLENLLTLLIGLSVATERLVEIIKGIINIWDSFLEEPNKNKKKERMRRLILQSIAVVAGVATAMLARVAFDTGLPAPMQTYSGTIICGFLASGGSGFWNSILTYILKVKELKDLNIKMQLYNEPK
jgi:hypothetical protein